MVRGKPIEKFEFGRKGPQGPSPDYLNLNFEILRSIEKGRKSGSKYSLSRRKLAAVCLVWSESDMFFII
jgi:hypothetical protein